MKITTMDASYRRLVVPVTGSPGDERVLALARQLTEKQPATITLVYVVEVRQSMPLDAELPLEIDRGEAVLGAAEAATRRDGAPKPEQVVTELLQARSAGAAIVDEAIERNADAIVMAACNRKICGRTTLGDTVEYVLKNAPCEVVVVRQGEPERTNGAPRWA